MNSFDSQKLFELLAEIPRGKVTTYGRLAEKLGNRKYARAVGNALHINPDGNRYSCYRVVNSQGKLSQAYAFGGIEEQKVRLMADGVDVCEYCVDLKKFGC